MHRRTVLKLAAGAAGGSLIGAAFRPETAAAAGSFVDLAGWPSEARFDAIATGRSGSWAVGTQRLEDRPDGGWQRRAILRRLRNDTWEPVALPDDFAAWARTLTPDPTGVWIVADRNDVSLPDADGSIVVGHLHRDGRWRALNTDSLPRYSWYRSLRLAGDRIELTGGTSTEAGPRPFCVSRPIHNPSAAWTEHPVEAPPWGGDLVPILKIGSGTTDWATAGAWLLRRSGSGWRAVGGLPGDERAWREACAVAAGSLYLSTADPYTAPEPDDPERYLLHRRVGATWTRLKLPPLVTITDLAPTRDGCWAVGDRYDPRTELNFAIALRISGSKVVQRINGPAGSVHMIDLARAERKILLGGIISDPQDPVWGDALGHAWQLTG